MLLFLCCPVLLYIILLLAGDPCGLGPRRYVRSSYKQFINTAMPALTYKGVHFKSFTERCLERDRPTWCLDMRETLCCS